MSILQACFNFGIFACILFAASNEFVNHPIPKEPIYLNTQSYGFFKKKLFLPPDKESLSQINDESILLKFQKIRTSAQCENAKSEIHVSLKSFFGAPTGTLSDAAVQKLSPFFEQIRNDSDYFIQKLKVDFPRQRPFLYIKGLSPCIPKEVTGAYPSGHAVLSHLFAALLSDLYPKDREDFVKRANQISEHRVLSGMHHPTDIEAGKELAHLLYNEFKKSEKFTTAFKNLN